MSPLFSIIGDSNIRRNMTGLNIASRSSMKSAQIIDCVSLATIEKSFQEVRAEAEVLILAAITGFLLEEGFNGTIFSTIDPVLATFATKLLGFCAARPNLQVRRYVPLTHDSLSSLTVFLDYLVSWCIYKYTTRASCFITFRVST